MFVIIENIIKRPVFKVKTCTCVCNEFECRIIFLPVIVTGLQSSSDVPNIRWILPVSRSATEQHVVRRKFGHDRETCGRASCSLPCFSVGLLRQAWLQVSTVQGIFYWDYEPAINFMIKKNFHHTIRQNIGANFSEQKRIFATTWNA